MTPDQFFDCCFADAMMQIRAYDDRLNDQWKLTRFLGYIQYCTVTETKDREDIYDFMPLADDPTKAERVIMKMEQARKTRTEHANRAKAMYERHEKAKEKFKQLVDKNNVK